MKKYSRKEIKKWQEEQWKRNPKAVLVHPVPNSSKWQVIYKDYNNGTNNK